MFGSPVLNAGTPHSKATGLHFPSHYGDYLCFSYAELGQNGIEGSSIFPTHFYNAVNFGIGKVFNLHND